MSRAPWAALLMVGTSWMNGACSGGGLGGPSASYAGRAGASMGGGSAGGVCEQGDTRACLGPGACDGAQQCQASGLWSDCDCGAQSAGGTGTGGGHAVGGSSGGSAGTGGSLGGDTGGKASGGNSSSGGTGGASTGGNLTGGVSVGGAPPGGAAAGGRSSGGMTTGGSSSGGRAAGGAPSGGTSAGGTATGGAGGAIACLDNWRDTAAGLFCTSQAQYDVLTCVEFLDCYQERGCSPNTCGSPDAICGINSGTGYASGKTVADQVYAALCG